MEASNLPRNNPAKSYACFPQPWSLFYHLKRPNFLSSKSIESCTNRLESIKCGANLLSDRKVCFSQKFPVTLNPVFNPDQPHMWLSTVKNRDFNATLSFELATVLHQHEPHLSHGEDRNHQSCFLTEIFTKHMAILCTLQPEMELSTVERISVTATHDDAMAST